MPRVLLAAPGSGSGKTVITCGIIEAFKRRGLRTAAFKCGPDYIDPMFHRGVLGVPSGNLDTFFTGGETTKYLLAEKARDAQVTVLEGMMGYYDGPGGQSDAFSTYEIARVTSTPVILIVDAKKAGVSLAAAVKGFLEYREDNRIRAVLLNRASPGYFEKLKGVIERECGVEVLGYVPELEALAVPSRHLGLIAPEELEKFREWAQSAAEAVERGVDLDRVLAVAGEAGDCKGEAPDLPRLPQKVRIAVARDEAFSFYYQENLDLLSEMGAELAEFSPLHDTELPEEIDGLLLGGGYPENHAAGLEAACGMREAVRKACAAGLPCLAECGGFLYLQEELEGADGTVRKMAGALPGRAYRTPGLRRFGYVEAASLRPGVLGEAGPGMRGHEFHHWDCTRPGEDFEARKPLNGGEYRCMIHTCSMAAGFPHFYYYSNPGMIYQFLQSCAGFRAGRLAKAHWDSIAKPIDSLGLLEDMVVKICRAAGSEKPYSLQKRALLILCGDHGVVEEGVTQTGSEVTRIVSENFARGCSTVNYMAKSAGVDVYAVDLGIQGPRYPETGLSQGTVADRKIARGSGNIAREPAMTVEQCRRALETGRSLVRELKDRGYGILATGEMGIGNTTPTSALAAALLNRAAGEVTGKGAGLSEKGLERKREVVKKAVDRVREKGLTDPVEILAEIGGYEIAGLAGVFLGGAQHRIPIVIDGAISAVAALAAVRIDERAAGFSIASHEPEEAAGRLALEELGVEAVLRGRMCLGEGTGAVAVFPLLDMAMEVYGKMGTFTDYEIRPYTRFDGGA